MQKFRISKDRFKSKSEESFRFKGKTIRISVELAKALEKLQVLASYPQIAVLVEGKRDAEALVAVGIPKKKILLWGHKTIDDLLAECLRKKITEIIDMLDADAAGRKKSTALYAAGKIKINQKLKKIILGQIKSRKIEDLLNFLEKKILFFFFF